MSARRSAKSPDLRIGVPTLFTEGHFEQALIMTYGADLEFYERVLRRHFGSYRNQVVLVDGHELDRSVAAAAGTNTLRHLNRSWLAGPIRHPHSAHAKLLLLAGSECAVLLVGSGNLYMGGYAGAGECFTPYRWTPDHAEGLPAFTAVRALTDGLAARGLLDAVTRERIQVFWGAYDWWHHEPVADGPVRHNLETPLGQQLVDAVGDERVEELVIAAPFHDRKCAALDRLLTELKPRRVRVVVQPRQSSVDPTALDTVLRQRGGEVFSIDAAGDTAGTYLHAKVFIAKTNRRAVCLTGSANCSLAALWTRHPDANVELGNLASGEPDAFDSLFDPGVVTLVGPVDPFTLGVAFQDDPDDDGQGTFRVEDLRWEPPIVSGVLDEVVQDPSLIIVEVQGRVVAATVTLRHETATSTRFEARLSDPADVEAIERVAVIVVRIGDERAVPAIPYQVSRLREQDRRRVDAERLRHAARLDLDDPDLEQALAALEEILIGENVARWTHGHHELAGDDDDGAAGIAWDEIDWASVRRHPRFTAYGGLAGLGAVAGSDLAAYLEALSRAVRELAEPEPLPTAGPTPPSGAGEEPEEDDEGEDADSGVSGGVEGADVDDIEDDEADEVSARRRQSIAARNLRLIRNFVRRNLRALEQTAFRAGVGAGVVVPNVIILNWVCWWVATKDEERPGELADERLRLWRLLWGAEEYSGYLNELDDEQRTLVLERFDDQRFEAVTLASMVDVWTYVEYGDSNFKSLRDVLRHAVVHPYWQVSAQHLLQAARLANGRPTAVHALDAVGLADALWDAACTPLGDLESRAAVAAAAEAAVNDVTLSEEWVRVDSTAVTRPVVQMYVAGLFNPRTVKSALAAWLGTDHRDYYRLKWNGGVALYRTAEENGWVYTEADDSMIDIGRVTAASPPWRVELDRLFEAAEAAAQPAA